MSAKTFLVCFALSFIAVISTLPSDSSACSDVSSAVCRENVGFIRKRDFKDDFSVAYSHYIAINMTTYDEQVSMHEIEYSHKELPDPIPFEKDGKELVKHIEEENLIDSLSTSLGDISEFNPTIRYNYFVVYAAIDLMNYHYTKIDHNNKVWKFSAKQIIEERQDVVYDIYEILQYLSNEGVCEMEAYDIDAASCRHYIIDGASYKYKGISNEYLYNLLQTEPLYVQFGLHPMYFQFYSPKCEDPVHAGYFRPNYAGVLTGYDLTVDDEEYWELYIRRHGDHYNKVKLAAKFNKDGKPQHPFSGLSSKIFTIQVNDVHPVDLPIIPAKTEETPLITNTEELIKAVEEVIPDNTAVEDVKNLAAYASIFDVENDNTYDLTTSYPNLEVFSLVVDETTEHSIDKYIAAFSEFEGILSFPSQEDFENMQGITRRLAEEVPTIDRADLGETVTLEIKGVKSSAIRMGNNLFHNIPYIVRIEDCPKLKSVNIGNNAFNYGAEFIVKNNPSLTTLVFGNSVFSSKPVIADSALILEDVAYGSRDTKNFYMDIHGDKAFNYLQDYLPNGNVNENIDYYFMDKLPVEPTTMPPTELPGPTEEPDINAL